MNEKGKIHVCYALNDRDLHYAKYIGTSMQSILERTETSLVFHLLHDETLSIENKAKFEQLVHCYGAQICFYDMSVLMRDYLEKVYTLLDGSWLDWYSRAVIYRFCIWQVIPQKIDRVVYLDADTLVYMDVVELWQELVPECGLAAVGDVSLQQYPQEYNLIREGVFNPQKYFNSGVLLMARTRFWEQNDWLQAAMDFLTEHPLADFPDQDAMNASFIHHYRQLPYRYNRLVDWERLQKEALSPGIYHFSGHAIDLDFEDIFTRLYFDSFMKTPWSDAAFLKRFSHMVQQTYDIRTNTLNRLSNLFVRKKRIVIYEPEFTDWVQENIQLQSGEDVILCNPVAQHYADFIEAMISLKKTHVFLFFSESYPLDKKNFQAADLVEQEDFLDGKLFLPQRDGGYSMDGYRAFRKM